MGGRTPESGKLFHLRENFADERKEHAGLILSRRMGRRYERCGSVLGIGADGHRQRGGREPALSLSKGRLPDGRRRRRYLSGRRPCPIWTHPALEAGICGVGSASAVWRPAFLA